LARILRPVIPPGWNTHSLFDRTEFTLLFVVAVTGLGYQLSHSETIEIDHQNLTIRRNILGWTDTSCYPVKSCWELVWPVQNKDSKFGLECKVGWRRIRFGRQLSEEPASNIPAQLQHELPDVAQDLGRMPGGGGREGVTPPWPELELLGSLSRGVLQRLSFGSVAWRPNSAG
jgi:hypothetical protein